MCFNLIVFFNLILLTNLFGQLDSSYIHYYNSINDGDKYRYEKDHKKAYESYLKGFSFVNYVHSKYYIVAARLASMNKKPEETYKFLRQAILQCYNENLKLRSRQYRNFRKSQYYKQFKDSLEEFNKAGLSKINLKYKKIVDSLYYVDQRIIRGNKTVNGTYNIDISKLPKNLYSLDSLLFKELNKLIEEYGFPSEKIIGYESFSNVSIIFHHNVRRTENKMYLPMLKEALFKGDYLPEHYAWMYDQSRNLLREKPFFYYTQNMASLTTEELKELDKRRKEYGVKPLAAYKMFKIRGWNVQIDKW